MALALCQVGLVNTPGAAFDCVDHDILLSKLQSSFGLGGITLTWILSCLTDRSIQRVLFNGSLSIEIMFLFHVPQGSVLGPILFLLYAAEIFDIIASFGLSGHIYADYSQLRAGIRIADSCSPVGYMCQKSRSMDGVQQTEIKHPLRLS